MQNRQTDRQHRAVHRSQGWQHAATAMMQAIHHKSVDTDVVCIYTSHMQPGYKLYPLVYLVAIYIYPVSATKLSSRRHVSTSRTLLRTCTRPHVDRYKLLVDVWDGILVSTTCIWCKCSLRHAYISLSLLQLHTICNCKSIHDNNYKKSIYSEYSQISHKLPQLAARQFKYTWK